MTLENRPTESRLPAGDDPYVWVDDRKMIVSSVGGVMAPGAWIGVHVNAVRQPIAEEFNFHVEVAEVDGLGRPTSIVQQCSLRMNVSNEPKELLPVDSHLPARAPACYRIKTSITREGFTETRYAYITVPDQILNAELIPASTNAQPGDRLDFALVNTGPTDLFFGVDYRLEREDGDTWTGCNVEEAWRLIGLSLEPGGRHEGHAELPKNPPPGRYRVIKDVSGVGTNLQRTVSFEFHVPPE